MPRVRKRTIWQHKGEVMKRINISPSFSTGITS